MVTTRPTHSLWCACASDNAALFLRTIVTVIPPHRYTISAIDRNRTPYKPATPNSSPLKPTPVAFKVAQPQFISATAMGALLSLPLLAVPSVTTVLSFAASCCGAATCSMVCSACGKCGNRYSSPLPSRPPSLRPRLTLVLLCLAALRPVSAMLLSFSSTRSSHGSWRHHGLSTSSST